MTDLAESLREHQANLSRCRRCPKMNGLPVYGEPIVSKVLLVGQAPGSKEVVVRKPFAWTAGKTLFGWFAGIGLPESAFRRLVHMSAVCRCFPGKSAGGGDREPSRDEVSNCSSWLQNELDLLRPALIVPVGRLAIASFLPPAKLEAVIGNSYVIRRGARAIDVIPLPHPSGASVWPRIEPGRTLVQQALGLIAAHPAWQRLLRENEWVE
jgi:uracil-DNA glycosylase